MSKKEDIYNLEVSDILESEQEDFVIEKIQGYVNKDYETLKDYFKATDTIEVKKLSESQAKTLSDQLRACGVATKVYRIHEKRQKKEASIIVCPRCRCVLDFRDWRCPECYYEFPDYAFEDDNDLKDSEE